jgi:hypothetical protein
MRFSRSVNERSMINATAMTEASNKNHIGQPAAWMIANKLIVSGRLSFDSGCAHFSQSGEDRQVDAAAQERAARASHRGDMPSGARGPPRLIHKSCG